MLETFKISLIKDFLFNKLLSMHCSTKIVQYNKLVCNLYISQLLKKGGRTYNMNILSPDLCICFKIIFLFAFVFLLFVFFIVIFILFKTTFSTSVKLQYILFVTILKKKTNVNKINT